MTNYVTKNQIFKGAWAVFVIVVGVAGWSFKIIADHSTAIGKLETTVENEIELRRERDLVIKIHTNSIAELKTKYAEQKSENKYIMRMIEMLLEKERIPLPDKPEQKNNTSE